jgi:gamma-glutamyltranspeptidase/glutathione hydrolase
MYALRRGGNAVDALIAAQLAATISEPILTGLCGSGIGMLHNGKDCYSIDMFTTHPGLHHYKRHILDTITINFGPTSQDFSIGLGSIATPTLWKGLLALHQNFSKLPLEVLAEPAISAAENGVHINRTIAYVLEILWPICSYTPEIKELLNKDGKCIKEGDLFHAPQFAQDIRDLVRFKEGFLTKGRIGDSLWPFIKDSSSLTVQDVLQYEVCIRKARSIQFADSTVWLPSAPSIGAEFVSRNLQKVEDDCSLYSILKAQHTTCSEVNPNIITKIFDKANNPQDLLDFTEISAGFTSHISVIDDQGWGAGLTSSLGESCGAVIPGTGLILNNFLGEDDVCPEFIKGNVGQRLMTMCTPTIARNIDSTVYVMGSGGSTRIRTSIFFGLLNLLKKKMKLEDAVRAPRIHMEKNMIQLELHEQDKNILDTIKSFPEFEDFTIEFFEEPSMFFGGLHTAMKHENMYQAHGDPRRDGIGKILT